VKLFIAGIGGTFMAGIAQIAKSAKHEVSGCDDNIYPPMSTVLEHHRIQVKSGYSSQHLEPDTEKIIIGNALSRGNPLVEDVLNRQLDFQSAPQWLHDQILKNRKVIAVAGTHGKTTTSSLLAWVLRSSGEDAGFLIGGKPGNFKHSAEIGGSRYFVIEADEYDTAFFDKRSKFVHYAPHIAVLNNLEFDHADIFSDLEQIKTQFHHLVRIVPSNGHIIVNQDDVNLREVLDMGHWTPITPFSTTDPACAWYAEPRVEDFSRFAVFHHQKEVADIRWNVIGRHNLRNALAAIVTSHLIGIDMDKIKSAFSRFAPPHRRLQLLYQNDHISLYEDFAHHPTAIQFTIEALKAKHPNRKILAVIEPRSNTMKMTSHVKTLGQSIDLADTTIFYQSARLQWKPQNLKTRSRLIVCAEKEEVLQQVNLNLEKNSVIICMSNGSFDGIPSSIKRICNAAGDPLS